MFQTITPPVQGTIAVDTHFLDPPITSWHIVLIFWRDARLSACVKSFGLSTTSGSVLTHLLAIGANNGFP